MCHRVADANMSFYCLPYLTINTKTRLLTGSTPAGSGRGESLLQCIINLFIIPHYSLLIISSQQKNIVPSLFLSLQMPSVRVWLEKVRKRKDIFSTRFLISFTLASIVFFIVDVLFVFNLSLWAKWIKRTHSRRPGCAIIPCPAEQSCLLYD